MMRKLIKWVLGLTVLLCLIVFIGLPLLANTAAGRERLASAIGRALDREVKIGGLSVGFFFRSVDLEGLSIAQPRGFPQGAMIEAERLHMDANLRTLFDGTLKSGIEGSGLTLHVIKKGGKTSLDGFAGRDRESRESAGDIPDLDFALDLSDGTLIVEDLDEGERLEVHGVSATMRLTNLEGIRDVGLTIRVDSVDKGSMRIRDLVLDSKLAGPYMEISRLSATLPGEGTLTGQGRVRVREGEDWRLRLDLKRVSLDADMMPTVGAMVPLAASAGGNLSGLMAGSFELEGQGLTWEAIKPNMTGAGRVTLTGLGVPAGSVVAQLTKLAGGSGAVDLTDVGAEFRIKKGWIEFDRLFAAGARARYDLAGKVSLDGDLRLSMDLMPLVKIFGGGRVYRKVSKLTGNIPVRIRGTTLRPSIKGPKPEDLAKGLVRRGLGDIFDKFK